MLRNPRTHLLTTLLAGKPLPLEELVPDRAPNHSWFMMTLTHPLLLPSLPQGMNAGTHRRHKSGQAPGLEGHYRRPTLRHVHTELPKRAGVQSVRALESCLPAGPSAKNQRLMARINPIHQNKLRCLPSLIETQTQART